MDIRLVCDVNITIDPKVISALSDLVFAVLDARSKDADGLLKWDEFCGAYGISRSTLKNWVKAGYVKSVSLGGSGRVKRYALTSRGRSVITGEIGSGE